MSGQSEETGSGKTNVYLDHNVLDHLVKYPDSNLFQLLIKDSITVFFTEETFNEIDKCGDYKAAFLAVLEKLNAQYLDVALDENGLSTDTGTLRIASAKRLYEIRKSGDEKFKSALDGMHQLLFKLHGGHADKSFEEILDLQVSAYDDLMDFALSIDSEEAGDKGISEDLYSQAGELKQKYVEAKEKLLSEIEAKIENHDKYSGIKGFREKLNLNPQQLNNISEVNAIKEIWELLKKHPEFPKTPLTLERFLGIDENPTHPNLPMPMQSKIVAAYGVLNLVGLCL